MDKELNKEENEEIDDEFAFLDKTNKRRSQIDKINLDDHEKDRLAYILFAEDEMKKNRYKVGQLLNRL